ncbi:enoyl-CoA hydratase [Pseudohongiella acticola]|mgnify:CR=1 FL=1|jgi:enoyl-CoA hydratase/carnithine racemase|uniref:Enoyl-CoA hydratase n=1 Tax=Pseudohongiella acticola TaxID=1524254 RepID=A0A1E8CMF7_9GAMM|nr:crotonase/enoyl-CoA hydratase family protein [Pseudohongiella acticola]OFE13618.1 enoyl-CoA hydratase [Pseudohongiella acticola]
MHIDGIKDNRVTVNLHNGIADVRLNRADKRNALDDALFQSLAAAGDALTSLPGLRAVVLSGEGESFCAGLDFGSFKGMSQRDGKTSTIGTMVAEDAMTHLAQQVCWVWQEVPVPVIAALQGHALGGGMQIALCADIRIAHPDTQLSVREVFWGLIPDMTGTLMLSQLVRPDVARELVYSARILQADEGHALGLITHLSEDPLVAAQSLATEIASRSPDAVRAAKRLLTRKLKAEAAEQFAAERQEIHRLIGSANQNEAVKAYFEKREPEFTDADSGELDHRRQK